MSEEDQPDNEYYVEAIRAWRYNLGENRKEFFIKWVGYPEGDNTWEPEDNLQCPRIFDEFKANLPADDYFHADRPDKLTGFQRNADFLKIVGCDGPHDSDDEGSDKPKKQKFYILALFDDNKNVAEEVTIHELFKYRKEDALCWMEERLLLKGDDSPPLNEW